MAIHHFASLRVMWNGLVQIAFWSRSVLRINVETRGLKRSVSSEYRILSRGSVSFRLSNGLLWTCGASCSSGSSHAYTEEPQQRRRTPAIRVALEAAQLRRPISAWGDSN